MAEVDYQMALVLQYKIDQERKQNKTDDCDYALAVSLQEQFNSEAKTEAPDNNLVYESSKHNNSKCLTDPSWEVIDPTPDIHLLFMAFNKKFFWNELLAVTVSWSKRMTSCAGVCSYQGRGGLCSITLSEPLLKLRPRKDLVETLLHEMIHAFLFVTHNNRDRDGHGPEFHKHMYRINAEAGTKITVYHNFHDEVRLYQTHWWRCNGPCQFRKPYFGFIRRSINRAPGPQDRWWESHNINCGGQFIKVKSPEPTTRSSKKNNKLPKPKESTNDIRKYIFVTGSKSSPNKENKVLTATVNVKITTTDNTNNSSVSPKYGTSKSINGLSSNNVHSLSNTASTSNVTKIVPSKTSNIYGFTGLNGNSFSKTSTPKKDTSGIRGAVKNAGSNVFVINKKKSNESDGIHKNTNNLTQKDKNKIEPFNGVGKTLSTSSSVVKNDDYSVVRDHWLNKFDNPKTKGSKRPCNDLSNSPLKITKTSSKILSPEKSDSVQCPVCQHQVLLDALNDHLDSCLIACEKNTKECIICGENLPATEYEVHLPKCSEHIFNDSTLEQVSSSKSVQNDSIIDLTDIADFKNCPVCKAQLSFVEYDCHVENCILEMCDLMDEKYDFDTSTKTPCLVCNKEILKSEINSHLEKCEGMNNTLESTCISVDKEDDKTDGFDCPFCFILVAESDIQSHLRHCFNSQCEKEKCISELMNGGFDSE